MRKTVRSALLFSFLPVSGLAFLHGCAGTSQTSAIAEGSTLDVAILATSDLHQNVLGYDYYAMKPDASIGLERTATLIREARAEQPNNILLDDGDAIQGTLLGDYQAMAQRLPCSGTLAVYKAMNALRYDAAAPGNHEFNYGLDFLSQVTHTDFHIPGLASHQNCGGPNFPIVAANVSGTASGKPIFAPYAMLDKPFSARSPDGKPFTVKLHIGITGFVPPQIVEWDKRHLAGKVEVQGALEAAQKAVPQLRSAGADLVVGLLHGGLDPAPYTAQSESAGLALSHAGFDALVLGHMHQIFPAAREPGAPALDVSFASLPSDQVDAVRGFVNGVPAVMPQSWGRRLGLITLHLQYHAGHWVVQREATSVEARGFKYRDGKMAAEPDAAIAAAVAVEHQATIAYARQPLGTVTEYGMASYFALAGDSSTMQVVNRAQIARARQALAESDEPGLQALRHLPIISCSAPFKAGRNGPTDYTDVAPEASAGYPVQLEVRSPGDLYLYGNNDMQLLKITGRDLKNWLETSARQFARIAPQATKPQDLAPSFSTIYNFDVFYAEGNALRYEIDVSREAGARIASLRFQGKPVAADDVFLVATNSYRASGGGNFPGIDASKVVLALPDSNQAIVADYLLHAGKLAAGDEQSWRFTAVKTAGVVYLRSAPGHMATAASHGISVVVGQGETDAAGFAHYRIDLGQ